MNRIALTLLVGVLVAPVALSAQDNPLPAQAPPPPGQNQQTPPPGGRGGRGTAAPAAQQTPTPEGRGGRVVNSVLLRADAANLQNVRVDLTLTDTLTADSPSKKTVTMVVVDGDSGAIRSQGNGGLTLNIDAEPHIRSDGRIFVNFSLQYLPPSDNNPNRGAPALLNESMSVIVSDGKPMIVSQSADPRNDRKVTVEVTASVVK